MAARSLHERIADVLKKFETEVNLWAASASSTGDVWLIPLTFYWSGTHLVLATPTNSRTARNLRRAGVARLALAPTSDVVIIEGDVTAVSGEAIDPELAEAHARRAGFDGRRQPGEYIYLLIYPRTIQAWRGPEEMAGRAVMRDGQWLETPAAGDRVP